MALACLERLCTKWMRRACSVWEGREEGMRMVVRYCGRVALKRDSECRQE
jgi:hypothetical protein